MSKSRKILVLFFVLVAIFIIVFSYLYLSGVYPGVHGYKVNVYFKEISGLKTGAMVFIRGMEKGKVSQIEVVDKGQQVRVQIIVAKDVALTEDTKFSIRSLSYFGTDRILTMTPGNGAEVANTTKFYGINEVLELEGFFLKFDNLVTKLQSVSVDSQLISIKKVLFGKFDTLAKGLEIPLTGITTQLEALVIKLDTLGDYLKSEGTVKKLVTSEELYHEVLKTNQKLRELLEDIKTNPKKYLTVKIF